MTETALRPPAYDSSHSSLYASDVAKREMVGVQKARETFAVRIDRATAEGLHTVVAKRGEPQVVIVPIEWYRRAAEAVGDPTEF